MGDEFRRMRGPSRGHARTTPNFVDNVSPRFRHLSAADEAAARGLVAELRAYNGVPIPPGTKPTRWPKQVGKLEDGLRFNRQLTPQEMMTLSELYQAEIEMVVYQNGSVLVRKGPSVGHHHAIHPTKGDMAGRTVGGAFPDPDNVVKLYHTHPSAAPGRQAASVEDMMRGWGLKNLNKSQKFIVTRNRNADVKVYRVHDLP